MKKHTILVVDAQQEVVNRLSGILREEGYCTLTASGGREVLEQLRGNAVCLIISNGAMRGLSAEELLKKAGKSSFPPLQIILTDTKEVQQKYSEGKGNEICWFITEPWEKEELLFTVRNALKYADLLTKNEALLETASVLAAKDISLEDKLQRILTISLTQISAEKGSIMLRDKQGDLVIRAATKRQILGVKKSLEDERSVSVWVVRNGKSLFVENCKEDSRFKPSEKALYKTNNFLCVPIKNENNTVIGVFNVTDKMDGELITKEDENTLSEFISRIVILIENAQLKEELEEERDRLKKKNKEIIALEQMKEDLVNMIVHDLKGPLAEVMANLDLLSYVQLECQDRECLDSATQGCESLLRMVLNLLDVRRMEEGRLKIHCEEFDVGNIIREVVEKYKATIKQREIRVKTVIDEKISTWIADRSLIERILSNLLINAIGYSHRGGEIEIVSEYHQGENQLRIEVRDKGKGIPRKFQRAIFKKFSQLDSGHSKKRISTGLGLTFCKLAVETHRGKIWVESEEGRGSNFIFFLPVGEVNDLT